MFVILCMAIPNRNEHQKSELKFFPEHCFFKKSCNTEKYCLENVTISEKTRNIHPLRHPPPQSGRESTFGGGGGGGGGGGVGMAITCSLVSAVVVLLKQWGASAPKLYGSHRLHIL